jgi:hypothetical protein
MDAVTFVSSLVSSMGISAATAAALSKQLIRHRLTKDLAQYKDKLGKERDAYQAALRKETETILGERAADRDYELAAKKRLYAAIGPLKFQLLLACRDLGSRIAHFAKKPYVTRISGYYGQTLLYRILRPIAVSDLIERQMAYADFAVDAGAIEVLRFRRALFEAWSGDTVPDEHPAVNWHQQEQHVFSDQLRRAASVMIVRDTADRVMYHDEFHEFVTNSNNHDRLHPFPRLLDGFSINAKPLLWIRLVCVGLICNEFIETQGRNIGLKQAPFRLHELLETCNDEYIRTHFEECERKVRGVAALEL